MKILDCNGFKDHYWKRRVKLNVGLDQVVDDWSSKVPKQSLKKQKSFLPVLRSDAVLPLANSRFIIISTSPNKTD